MTVREVASGRADRPGQEDIGRSVVSRPFILGHDTAILRVLDTAAEQPASLHHLMARVVDGRRGMIHAPDQRHLIHHRGQPGKDLGDLKARHLGRDRPERAPDFLGCIRLHIPGIELGWAADQKQQDATDVAISRYGSSGRQGFHRRQPQSKSCQRPGVQEIAASQPITKVDRLLRINLDHVAASLGWGRAGKFADNRFIVTLFNARVKHVLDACETLDQTPITDQDRAINAIVGLFDGFHEVPQCPSNFLTESFRPVGS